MALEQESRPLSVVVGLETEDPALSEAGSEHCCSVKTTPPKQRTRTAQGKDTMLRGVDEMNLEAGAVILGNIGSLGKKITSLNKCLKQLTR